VIADKAGKEQLTQVVARREAARGRRAGKANAGRTVLAGRWSLLGLSWVVWAGILLVFGSAGVVAAVFTVRW
jgi:hypothetical protein